MSRRNQFKSAFTLAVAALSLLSVGNQVQATVFSDDFNGYSGNQNNAQFQSNLEISHSGTSPGWSSTGGGAIHAVDLANLNGQNNPSNYAPMIWQDNVLTQAAGIAANVSGFTYSVNFDASAAVYAAGGQATQAHDAIKVDVLRSDNSVLASYMHAPGAWTGNMLFGSDSFQYIGDGSGDVRLRIGPNTAGDGHFQGSIDNIVVNFADAGINVPEPATATLALLGLGGLMMRRRRAS